MAYRVLISEKAEKTLAGLDNSVRLMVVKWLKKHLEGCDNPRATGKALVDNLSGYWRYRVGDYRIIAEIRDTELIVLIIDFGHRSVVYSK